jgi:Na+-driven multidrug efflux pump
VGNLMGAQQPAAARMSAKISIMLGLGVMTICGVIIMALKGPVARLFTHDAQVVKLMCDTAPFLAALQVTPHFLLGSRHVLVLCCDMHAHTQLSAPCKDHLAEAMRP